MPALREKLVSEFERWIMGGIVSAVLAAVTGLFIRVRTNESRIAVAEKTLGRFEDTEKTVTDVRLLTAKIETHLAHLPRQDDLQKLHDRISKNGTATGKATAAVAELGADVRGLRDAVNRLHKIETARSLKK